MKAKIFVIDDSIASLKITKAALPDCDVFTAASATEMFAMLESHKPDLVLLDNQDAGTRSAERRGGRGSRAGSAA